MRAAIGDHALVDEHAAAKLPLRRRIDEPGVRQKQGPRPRGLRAFFTHWVIEAQYFWQNQVDNAAYVQAGSPITVPYNFSTEGRLGTAGAELVRMQVNGENNNPSFINLPLWP